MRRLTVQEQQHQQSRKHHGRADHKGRCHPVLHSKCGQQQERDGNAHRPGVDENRHGRGHLPAGEPVDDHLRHEHIEQNAARAGDKPSGDLTAPRGGQHHGEAANDHKYQAGEDSLFVAKYSADCSTWQRQRYARCKIQPDQQADVSDAHAVVLDDQRGDGGDALILDGHCRADGKQHGQNAPPT
jgi:hypothetical protein